MFQVRHPVLIGTGPSLPMYVVVARFPDGHEVDVAYSLDADVALSIRNQYASVNEGAMVLVCEADVYGVPIGRSLTDPRRQR